VVKRENAGFENCKIFTKALKIALKHPSYMPSLLVFFQALIFVIIAARIRITQIEDSG
jgi:hypothetical protein